MKPTWDEYWKLGTLGATVLGAFAWWLGLPVQVRWVPQVLFLSLFAVVWCDLRRRRE